MSSFMSIMHLYINLQVRVLASKVFDVAEVVYKTIIKDRVPGEPPVVLESQLFTIVAERLAIHALNKTNLDIATGSFQMPTMDTILTQNTSFVDTKVYGVQKQILFLKLNLMFTHLSLVV